MNTGKNFENEPFGGSSAGRDPFGGAGPGYSDAPFGVSGGGFGGGVPYYNKPAGKASLKNK